MAGYTRQSVADIINGAEITAPPLNAEFNQLASAFDPATGHSHDGSSGNSPKIDLTTSITGYLPSAHGGTGGKNKFDATTAPAVGNDNTEGYAPGSLWENTTNGRMYVCVGNGTDAAVWRELVTVLTNNKIEPATHDAIDLGTPTVRFQDLYLQGGSVVAGNSTFGGTLTVADAATLSSTLAVTGASTLTGDVSASGALTVAGVTTLNGNTTIGNAATDTVTITADVASTLTPSVDGTYNLGAADAEWNDLYLDGTAHIDTLDVDENATVAGTLGVTGTTTLGTATLTNLTGTGAINFAGATISNLGTVTTAAIGGGTINNAVIGGSTAAAITGTTITATTGFSGDVTGDVTGDLTGDVTGNVTGDVTGDLTGNVTASSGTSTFNNVTVNGNLNMDATSAATITNLTAPTNDLDAATKLYVDTAVADLVDSAPDSLNTLNELAAAINDDASAYNTLNTAIGEKLPKAGGTMSGAINMGGQKVTNAGDPTAAQDLATKNYIDTTYIDYSSAADAANDAEKLAINAEDAQYTLSDNTTTGYSALHYAAKAEASYDSFDDRYLGSKATDPTVDNDGDALITGALYFDSTNGVMKVYNGTEWANASSSIEGIKSNFYYTATSGQTAFSGTDDNSNTLVIDKAGLVNVYMNGVRLHEDDYTVSAAGDSVTLAAGAATGDLIYLEVFGNFAGQSGADVAITGGSITGLSSLSVTGTGVDPNVLISNTTNGDVSLTLRRVSANDAYTDWTHMNDGGRFKLISDDNINNDAVRMQVDYTGDIDFYDTSGTNVQFHWDAADERLGLGTTAPATPLHVKKAGLGIIRAESTGTSGAYLQLRDANTTSGQQGWIGMQANTMKFFSDNTKQTLSLAAEANVFNDSGYDQDFRVESNNSTHALYLDAGSDFLGVNTSSPGHQLDVYTNKDNKYIARFTQDHATGYGVLIDTDATSVNDPILWLKNATTTALWAGSNGYVGINNTAPTAPLNVTGDITQSPVGAVNAITAGIRTSGVQTNDTGKFKVNYGGTEIVSLYGQWSGSQFQAGMNLPYLPLRMIGAGNQRLTLYSGGIVVNEDGLDHDFRVESDTDTHALYVDAANNRIGLGTSAPKRQLTVSNSGAALLLLESTGNDNSQVLFGDNDSDTVGKVMYRHSDNRMTLSTGGEERFHIRGDGSVVAGDVANVSEKLAGYHFLDDSYSYWSGTLSKYSAAMRVETKWDASGGTRSAGAYGGGIAFNHLGGHSATHDSNVHALIGLKVYDTPSHERSSLIFATNDSYADDDGGLAERMAIDPYGRVTMPYQPAFLQRAGGDTGFANTANTWYRLKVWNQSHINRGGDFDTTNTNDYYVAPVDGVYFIFVQLREETYYGGWGDVRVRLTKNGTRMAEYRYWDGDQSEYSPQLQTLMNVSANDIIAVEFYSTSTDTNLAVEGSETTFFGGYLIG